MNYRVFKDKNVEKFLDKNSDDVKLTNEQRKKYQNYLKIHIYVQKDL